MVINVCPAATSKAPPDRFWSVLTKPEEFGRWTDARFVRADPAGPVKTGQAIHLAARFAGRDWPVRIDVGPMDPARRWIDLVVHLPFGVANHEHLTLAETAEGGSLVRFN